MLVNYEKQTTTYTTYASLPLTARPLDFFYFIFFLSHIPSTLLFDPHALFTALRYLRGPVEWYIEISHDPLVGVLSGALGDSSHRAHLSWFKSFLILELLFQLPVFFIGARGLYKGCRTIYPLLALYASSTATTTLACVFHILQTPKTTPETLAQNLPSITPDQRLMLLSSYIPYFLIPFIMAVDMGIRTYKLVKIAIKKEEKQD